MPEINATISKKTPQLDASLPGTLLAGVPGKSAYQFAVEGGYTGTEEEFAKKLASEYSGVSSWNDLTDKPFEVVAPSYTIEWDGDMTGRPAIDLTALGFPGAYFVQVSDMVLTDAQLLGALYIFGIVSYETINEIAIDDPIPGVITGGLVASIYDSDAACSAVGVPSGTYPNGTYFYCHPGEGSVALLRTTEAVKKLEEKYLPDSVVKKGDLELNFPTHIEVELDGAPTTYYFEDADADSFRHWLLNGLFTMRVGIYKNGDHLYWPMLQGRYSGESITGSLFYNSWVMCDNFDGTAGVSSTIGMMYVVFAKVAVPSQLTVWAKTLTTYPE